MVSLAKEVGEAAEALSDSYWPAMKLAEFSCEVGAGMVGLSVAAIEEEQS